MDNAFKNEMQKKKKNMSKVNFYILGPLHVKSQQEKITKGEKITQQENTRYIFSSNQIVLKISFSLCFWAPDLLFDRF